MDIKTSIRKIITCKKRFSHYIDSKKYLRSAETFSDINGFKGSYFSKKREIIEDYSEPTFNEENKDDDSVYDLIEDLYQESIDESILRVEDVNLKYNPMRNKKWRITKFGSDEFKAFISNLEDKIQKGDGTNLICLYCWIWISEAQQHQHQRFGHQCATNGSIYDEKSFIQAATLFRNYIKSSGTIKLFADYDPFFIIQHENNVRQEGYYIGGGEAYHHLNLNPFSKKGRPPFLSYPLVPLNMVPYSCDYFKQNEKIYQNNRVIKVLYKNIDEKQKILQVLNRIQWQMFDISQSIDEIRQLLQDNDNECEQNEINLNQRLTLSTNTSRLKMGKGRKTKTKQEDEYIDYYKLSQASKKSLQAQQSKPVQQNFYQQQNDEDTYNEMINDNIEGSFNDDDEKIELQQNMDHYLLYDVMKSPLKRQRGKAFMRPKVSYKHQVPDSLQVKYLSPEYHDFIQNIIENPDNHQHCVCLTCWQYMTEHQKKLHEAYGHQCIGKGKITDEVSFMHYAEYYHHRTWDDIIVKLQEISYEVLDKKKMQLINQTSHELKTRRENRGNIKGQPPFLQAPLVPFNMQPVGVSAAAIANKPEITTKNQHVALNPQLQIQAEKKLALTDGSKKPSRAFEAQCMVQNQAAASNVSPQILNYGPLVNGYTSESRDKLCKIIYRLQDDMNDCLQKQDLIINKLQLMLIKDKKVQEVQNPHQINPSDTQVIFPSQNLDQNRMLFNNPFRPQPQQNNQNDQIKKTSNHIRKQKPLIT